MDLEADRERLLALLAVAYRHPASIDVLLHLRDASAHWQRGDKALANMRLAFAKVPRLDDRRQIVSLSVAEQLLDKGVSPRTLLSKLGFDSADLQKFDPSQPRLPAGSGQSSGQWVRAAVAVAGAAGSFLAGASPRIVSALAAFGSRLSVATTVLGALFIPTPNSGGITEGDLPGAPGIRFRKDGAAGSLRLTTTALDGTAINVFARNHGGLIINLRTDTAIGRDFGDQLYFDLDSVHDAINTEAKLAGKIEPVPSAKAAADEPKLCPAPESDVKHGASEASLDYEDDVHARVNPLAPIPRKFGVNLLNEISGEIIYFEDCFRFAGDLVDSDMKIGDLVEAKGERFRYLLGRPFSVGVMQDFVNQARKELAVADQRGVGLKWYFAEEEVAALARRRFAREKLNRIVVSFMPPRRRK